MSENTIGTRKRSFHSKSYMINNSGLAHALQLICAYSNKGKAPKESSVAVSLHLGQDYQSVIVSF